MRFQCWAKSVLNSKAATNQEASDRIKYLQDYVADIDGGVINFTTEEADLTVEVNNHLADMNSSATLRAQEAEQHRVSREDLRLATEALSSANSVVCNLGGNSSALAQISGSITARLNFKAFSEQGSDLRRAADIGEKFLSKGDALFLRRLLTADVPKPDYEQLKKLKEEGQLTEKYESRSKAVCATLEELQTTFEMKIQDADHAENEAVAKYTSLLEAQTTEKDRLEQALADLTSENSARHLSKEEATAEIAKLETQLSSDSQVVYDTNKTLVDHRKEYDFRVEFRKREVEALTKAIQILSADEARDLFAKTATGSSFLQVRQTSSLDKAVSTLWELGRETKDKRVSSLVILASQVTNSSYHSAMDTVVAAIDTLISELKSEGESDLTEKEDCETKRLTLTRTIATVARQVDEGTRGSWTKNQEIEHLKNQIGLLQEAIGNTQSQLTQMASIRTEENVLYQKHHAEILQSKALTVEARTVIEEFYSSHGTMLVQQPMVAGGALPPPPPPTWGEAYTGKVQETSGIIAILKVLQEDFSTDLANMEASEQEAQHEYESEKTALETAVSSYTQNVDVRYTDIASAEQEANDLQASKETMLADIAAHKSLLKASASHCMYITVHFQVRREARALELDGLENAKTILLGGHVGTKFLRRSQP